MCGGGVGSANNEDNDDEKGSGNSFKETLANIFTPGDGMSYKDGQLTEDNKNRDQQFYDYNSNNNNNDGPGYATIMVGGEPKQIRRDANDKYKQRYASALFGAATGGLPGLLGSIATNELTGGKTGAGVLGIGEAAGDAASSLKGIFAAPEGLTEQEKTEWEAKKKAQLEAHNAGIAQMENAGGGNNPGGAPTTVAPTVVLPGNNMPAPSQMSVDASQAYQPIPNPDYDPNDPMSQQFLSNPSYAQLLAYRQSQVPGLAQGGMLGMGIGMGFPGGPPMPGFGNETYGRQQRNLMPGGQIFDQYGNYLDNKYGDPSFDQKKEGFLQEIQQKEQQTFSGGGLQASNFQPNFFSYRESLMNAPMSQQPPLMNYVLGGENIGGANIYPDTQLGDTSAVMQGAAGPITSFAEGGEVGGNEKTAISDAISAVKGQMPEEQAAIALGMFVQNYGEEALKNLIERVQSGEFDDTVDRFANGEAGEVVGPGDGSGVDDKVPASLEGQQDVLLADGEFVLRKKTADALEKKYGGGFLDTVNEAEDNAPRTMQEYMARA
jgi:hypothetical protein